MAKLATKKGSTLRTIFVIAVALLLAMNPSTGFAVEPVKAELGKASAWAGEPVPLIITLYSEGPFSGTATFDLPELPLTTIVRGGSPTVGSEKVEEETYLTQRHELSVFTQRIGPMTIPPISVRFSGKKSFTSEAEPVEAQTVELTFESKRPDVPTELGMVVSASTMKATERWTPDSITEVTTGDVIERVIRREASDTTAMMMPGIEAGAPSDVRIHTSDPVVRDRSNRGSVIAERQDTIKYQFEKPGTFTIPSITVSWWDTNSEELEQTTFAERTFRVQSAVVTDNSPNMESANSNDRRVLGVTVLVLIVVAVLMLYRSIRPRLFSEERIAAAKVRTACRSNDAANAYASFLQWKRTLGEQKTAAFSQPGPFDEQQKLLTQHLYGESETTTPWSGEQFLSAFRIFRRRVLRTDPSTVGPPDLPNLNPTG